MPITNTRAGLVGSAVALLLLVPLAAGCADVASQGAPERSPDALPAPSFDRAFWERWGDGRAELAGYDLVHPRYGKQRRGVAVTIFVTETFSDALRVKADPGKHPSSDTFPVMKLNLVQDFPTGVYDYNLMTSAFVSLAPHAGRLAGSAVKVSFSAQEWCGHVYQQSLFDRDGVRHSSHSYFDGEADHTMLLPHPAHAVAEDGLLLWARGFAAPRLDPGDSVEVPMLRSLRVSRLGHVPEAWDRVRLARASAPARTTVPAGTFEVETLTAAVTGAQRTWTFHVERAEPHRIVRWGSSDGESAELLSSDRLAYWEMNAEGFEQALGKLGLAPRGPRMP